jgi:alginate O-acetyltransferase complex protein AlgI
MLFNSYLFMLVFLPATLGGYALCGRFGRRAGTGWLVLCSMVFYGWWDMAYLALILGSTLVNYRLGRTLAETRSRAVLVLGLAFNLGTLGWFKYAGLFSRTLADLTGLDGFIVTVALPLGISFFTFQKIAYLVDCWRGETKPYDMLEFSLFVLFFPQLIAGPIIHHAEFLPQYQARRAGLDADNVSVGLTLFIAGLFKKVVIAEAMARYASPMFDGAAAGNPITVLEAWSCTLAYTLQIYFDFSGYSDMALGLARMFGLRFPVNFNSPYKATSIIEFWRRWHITLSRFLRDYLYVPLGGNRHGEGRRMANLMVVMLLGGLWHGANWTFAAWGGLHGLFLVINHLWRKLTAGLSVPGPAFVYRALGWGLTFLAVMLAWVFFRAASFEAALNVFQGLTAAEGRFVVTPGLESVARKLAPLLGPVSVSERALPYFLGFHQLAVTLLVLGLALVLPNTQEWLHAHQPALGERPEPGRLARLAAWAPNPLWAGIMIVVGCIAFVQSMQPVEFIYWQF